MHISKGHELILASRSPRRKKLLAQVGLSFKVVPSTLDEGAFSKTEPEEHVRHLAELKAMNVADRFPHSWVIGADTEVVIDNAMLSKPKDPNDAIGMLKALSGRFHHVFTGYCICCRIRDAFFSNTVATQVRFRPLTDTDISWYVHTKEPFGKAGGYAVQGLGSVFIKRIEGSYTNVVGLPLCEVVEHLMQLQVVKSA